MNTELVDSALLEVDPAEAVAVQSPPEGVADAAAEPEPPPLPPAAGAALSAPSDQLPQHLDSVPSSVPKRRWLIRIAPKEYQPLYWDSSVWTPTKEIKPVPNQTASIDVRFAAELYLIRDLDSKVLRLTQLGNGFSTGPLHRNAWSERGVFQDRCVLAFGPSGDHPLAMGGNSPENQNTVAEYTSSTSFEVSEKLKASDKEGEGEETGVTYTVSSSVRTSLSDFALTNESGAVTARWSWALAQMGDNTPGYVYPYNGPNSLIKTLSFNICPLPALARGRLAPACQAYWLAPMDFNGTVQFKVTASQFTSYVVTNRLTRYLGFIAPPTRTTLEASPVISFDESLWDPKP